MYNAAKYSHFFDLSNNLIIDDPNLTDDILYDKDSIWLNSRKMDQNIELLDNRIQNVGKGVQVKQYEFKDGITYQQKAEFLNIFIKLFNNLFNSPNCLRLKIAEKISHGTAFGKIFDPQSTIQPFSYTAPNQGQIGNIAGAQDISWGVTEKTFTQKVEFTLDPTPDEQTAIDNMIKDLQDNSAYIWHITKHFKRFTNPDTNEFDDLPGIYSGDQCGFHNLSVSSTAVLSAMMGCRAANAAVGNDTFTANIVYNNTAKTLTLSNIGEFDISILNEKSLFILYENNSLRAHVSSIDTVNSNLTLDNIITTFDADVTSSTVVTIQYFD